MSKIRPLVPLSDPILKTRMELFDFSAPPTDPIELAHVLAQNLLHYSGFGLAAPQIGLPYRVFIIKANPMICCFNPKIVDKSEEINYHDEGCLSIPGVSIRLKRHSRIRVRYNQPNGQIKTDTFQNFTARIFQHELDHLDGILMTMHRERAALELALKKAHKMGYTYNIGELIRRTE